MSNCPSRIPKLQTELFPKELGPECGPTLTLELGETFSWHKLQKPGDRKIGNAGWRCISCWINEISGIRANLDESSGGLFNDPKSPCVRKKQPTWDLKNPFKDFEEEADQNGEAEHCGDWRMEHLAFYLPAHLHELDHYGVYLPPKGVAKCLNAIDKYLPKNHDISDSDLILAVTFMLFAHEMCHAWIEDLCCLLDKTNPANQPKKTRAYAAVHQRYNSYIFMEEAICNTAAYGWLKHFLNSAADDPSQPQTAQILKAIGAWMRKQPKGYRGFIKLEAPPHTSQEFADNVRVLLHRVYGYKDFDAVTDTVKDYFGNFPEANCFSQFPVYTCDEADVKTYHETLKRLRYRELALHGANDEAGLGDVLDII